MKLLNKIFLNFLIISAIFCLLAIDSQTLANQPNLQIQLVTPEKVSSGEKSRAKFRIQRTEENKNAEFTFNLSTNNSSLIRFETPEIKIAPKADSAEFNFEVSLTPIKTTVSIRVQLLNSAATSPTENTIEIFPAMLKSVTIQPSMMGTRGAKVEVAVNLKGIAPTGGIQIYLSPFFISGFKDVTIPVPSVQIPAGSTKTTFFIEYDEIREEGVEVSRFETNTTFNQQKRTIQFAVAVEPQQNSGSKSNVQWTAIPGIVSLAKFDVIPLQVSSLTVPAPNITGGTEALGSFTLNGAPGNAEKIYFRPRRTSAAKLWVVALGSSCQESSADSPNVEIPLTQGVTNYNFKVCSSSVPTAQTINIRAILRSGEKQIPITVQP